MVSGEDIERCLSTARWEELWGALYDFHEGCCKVCGSANGMIAETKWPVAPSRATINDLVLLCPDCDDKWHNNGRPFYNAYT